MTYQKNIIKKLIQISLIASLAVVASFLFLPLIQAQAATACGSTTFTDSRDGKTYSTVSIGDQCWMAQNLNVGTLTAGTNNQGTSCSSIQKY